jgi:TonB family protein
MTHFTRSPLAPVLLCALAWPLAALAQAVPDPVQQKAAPAPPPPAPLVPPSIDGELPQAAYPESGAGRTARVVLELDVTEQGSAQNAKVVSPPQPGFDESALQLVPRLRFVPARQGDKPLAVRIQFAINFAPPQLARAPEDAVQRPVNLAGQVRERGTRKKLAGFEVAVPAAGLSALTDGQGRFELRGVPDGKQQIVIAAPGYDRLALTETIEPGKKLEVIYLLQPLYVSPFEAVVAGEKERKEISKTSISIQEVNRIPGTQGDALKVIEDLPGAARSSPIGGGLLVIRGSNPGDSLVFLDGLSLPLLYHFGALSSTVSPDLLEGIDYVPGNFSVQYGDMVGGLVSVKTRPLREELHGYANLSLLESSVLLEGQVPGDSGVRVSVSGRKSYIGEVLKAVIPEGSVGLLAAPSYYDAQLRIDWKPKGTSHTLQFLGLTSDDSLSLLFKRPLDSDPNVSGDLDLETGFSQLRLKDNWRSGAWSVDTVAMYEHLVLRFGIGSNRFSLIGNDLHLRSQAAYEVGEALQLSFGAEAINQHLNVASDVPASALAREGDPNQNNGPRGDDTSRIKVGALPYNRSSGGLFAEARWKPLPRLSLTPGVRVDTYVYTGQATPKVTVGPRLTGRWQQTEELAFKAGAGLYSQGARQGDASKQFGNPDILPERAWQFTAGTEWRPLPGLFTSLEGFYKRLDDLVVSSGATNSGNQLDNAGVGRIYGLEVLVRKELTDRLFGWIAYTLSRSERVDRPGYATRLFDFDQTHNLTIVASYQLPRGWQLGARLRLISGNPDTPVLGARYLNATDAYLPIYGATNSARLPLFHQLDVRIDKVWTFDNWNLDLYLDVLNTYNHRSIEGTQYSYDYSQSAYIGGLPFFPSLGLKGAF